jgi:hypothetical protein
MGRDTNLKAKKERAAADVEDCVAPEARTAAATGRPAPNAVEKLKPDSPNLMTDAELLERLVLAAITTS